MENVKIQSVVYVEFIPHIHMLAVYKTTMKISSNLSKAVIIVFIVTLFFSIAFGGPGAGNNIFIGWFENSFPSDDSMSVYGGMILIIFLVFIALLYLAIKVGKKMWTYFRRAKENR